MRVIKENVSRKLDSLGRISVTKAMRQRLNIDDLSELEFYVLEDENTGMQYIGMAKDQEENIKYAQAIAVLQELGLEVPEALLEKV